MPQPVRAYRRESGTLTRPHHHSRDGTRHQTAVGRTHLQEQMAVLTATTATPTVGGQRLAHIVG